MGNSERLHLGNIGITRDWGWTPEYVEAMLLMLQQESPCDFVLATGETYILSDFAAEAFRCVGLASKDHLKTDPSLLRPSEIFTGRSNTGKALQVLGWKAQYKMRDLVGMMVEADMGMYCERNHSRADDTYESRCS